MNIQLLKTDSLELKNLQRNIVGKRKKQYKYLL